MFNVAHFSSSWWSEAFGPETLTFTERIESTQSQAKAHMLYECSNHGHLFISVHQTGGKGRGSKTWKSPEKGSAFLGSILQRMPSPPQPILTPLFGWAVHKTLNEAFSNANFSIKAPNDIYLNDKKVAGLLIDSLSQGNNNWVIFGLGVNVFNSPNISIATSLSEEGIDVNESSWSIFLKVLSTNLTLANQMSLNKELKPQFIKEITRGLKNFSENYVKTLTPNADLILEDETLVSWRDL